MKKGNDTSGLGSTKAPYATIQKAIDAASDGDIVQLYQGRHGASSTLTISDKRQLTIKGVHDADITFLTGAKIVIKDGAEVTFRRITIDADTTEIRNAKVRFLGTPMVGNRIFIDGGDLQIANCTITANNSAAVLPVGSDPKKSFPTGGAVFVASGSASLSHSIIMALTAEHGGAIYLQNGYLELREMEIVGNKAIGNAGGIYLGGGEATIQNTVFRENYANRGGALMVSKSFKGSVVMCTFVSNKAAYGGAVMTTDRTSPLFRSCNFTSNEAHHDGGAISAAAFSRGEFKDCVLQYNKAAKSGGGLYTEMEAYPTFTRTNFTANVATNGGGVGVTDSANPTFFYCEFVNNQGTRGAALHITDGGKGYWLHGCLRHNHAVQEGGAFYLELDARPKFNQTHFIWNDAEYGAAFMKVAWLHTIMHNMHVALSIHCCPLPPLNIMIQTETTHPRFYLCSVWPHTEQLEDEYLKLDYMNGKPLPYRLMPHHDAWYKPVKFAPKAL